MVHVEVQGSVVLGVDEHDPDSDQLSYLQRLDDEVLQGRRPEPGAPLTKVNGHPCKQHRRELIGLVAGGAARCP